MKTNKKNYPAIRRFILSVSLLTGLFISNNSISQVTVSGALVGSGSYADVKSAFTAINGGAQTGANIVINITGNTNETASAILNAGAWTSLVIIPTGGSYTVSGNIVGPLIDLNGADKVLIDGLNTGGNALTLSNTNTGNALVTTVRFVAAATNNTITNCTMLGSATSAALGVVTFSTAVSPGNSSNVISNCSIGPAGANFPVNGIYSAGTAALENVNNTVSNCNIYDFYSSTLATAGILVAANNSTWSFTGNRIYQAALRTYGTANTHRGIQVSSGNGYLVSNNIVGYASSSATGTWSMTSTVGTRFIAIDLAVGTASPSSVQGNTISAITLTTSSGVSTANGIICGINMTAGNVSVGNINGNLIGGTTGADLLAGSPTTANGMVVGINSSSTGTITIQTNTIGGLSSSGVAAAISGAATGINISGISTSLTITGNTIGNSTADNIRGGTNSLTTGNSLVSGIYLPSTPANTVIISGNTIQNLASYGTGTGYARGIWTAAAQSVTTTYSITSNILNNIISNSGLTTISNGQTGATGINLATGNNCVIASNTISGISLVGTAAVACYATGITLGNATSTSVFKNRIYNITNAGTSPLATAPGVASGIVVRSGNIDVSIYNNMVSLGNGSAGNTAFIGIMGNLGSSPNPVTKVYFNTINIEGTAGTGIIPTFGFMRGDFTATSRTSTVDLRNNIITNTRTGGTGGHYAIGNNYGLSATGQNWGPGATNYNVLNANAATIGWWSSALTFAGWKATTGCDANSFSGIAVTYVNPANDLHLNMGVTPTSIESGAQVIAGFNTDIDAQVRPGPAGSTNGGALFPDIGADEIDGAPRNCNSAVSGNILGASTYTACSGQTLIAIAPNASYALGTTYQWQVGATPGGPYANITAGFGMTTISHTSAPLPAGVYYVVLKTSCSFGGLTGLSNEVMLTVNTTPSVTASSTTTFICSSQSISLSGLPGAATNYAWNGPNGFFSTSQNTVISNASINARGTYSFTSLVNGCTSAPALVSVTVNATPTSLTLTPTSTLICAGSSQTMSVAGGDVPGGVMNFTPQVNQNGPTTHPAPYSIYWGGQKMQFLILASELSAAGLIAGPLTSVQFPVVSKGSNWGLSTFSCENFQVSLGLTSLTSFAATFQTGLTVVSSPSSFTPNVGYGNIHNFSPTFVWDGTSNLIVETIFSNNITGAQQDAVISYNSPTTFQSTMIYVADGVPFATIAAATTTNEPANLVRPDFILKGQMRGTYSWTPTSNLSAATGSLVTATPPATTVYTALVSTGNCSTSISSSINVTPMPTVAIIATPTAVCVGDATTLTATGATTYTWDSNAVTTAVTVTPGIITSYTVYGETAPCPVANGTIDIVINPLPLIAVSPPSATVCALSPKSFTASGADTYSWSSGSTSAAETVSPAANSIYTVTGTSSLGCSNTAIVGVLTNSLPVISITPPGTVICVNEQVNFFASGATTFSWSTGSQSVAITVTASANANYTVTGTNGKGCVSSKTVALTVDPCTGIANNSDIKNQVSVYPNPSSGLITVAFDFEGEKEILVTNALGAVTDKISTVNNSESIDLSAKAKGIYFISVSTKTTTANYRVIIQ